MSRKYRIGESDAAGDGSFPTTEGEIISTMDELTEIDGATEADEEEDEDADEDEDEDDRAGVL